MWDFLQYTSEERIFSGLFWSFSEVTGAGAGAEVGAWASKTALRIHCKLFLEYLETLVAATEDFGPGSPSGYSENFDSGGEEESRGVTEGAMEEKTERLIEKAIKKRFRQGRLQLQLEVILV